MLTSVGSVTTLTFTWEAKTAQITVTRIFPARVSQSRAVLGWSGTQVSFKFQVVLLQRIDLQPTD